MSEGDRALLIDRAVGWLDANAAPRQLPEPPAADLRALMEMATGKPMGDIEFAARRDLTCFRDYPYMAEWEGASPQISQDFKVVVIGSGFAGVGMGCSLIA